MPIQVTCPGCHTRFTVGDQHAGKTGACPKCKGPIQIPEKGDEVVIHEPELEAGSKDAKGRSVLKPIKRKEAKFSFAITAGIGGLVLLVVAIAWLFGKELEGNNQFILLTVGAILLGPPMAYAGYTFLRDDEKGYYQGVAVLVRSLICGLVYALLWGVYIFIAGQVFDLSEGLTIMQAGGIAALLAVVGAGAALVCYDLDMTSGFFNYVLYLLVTVGLRWVMGLALLPGLSIGT